MGVRFLGCSLFTDLFVDGAATADTLECQLNDYRNNRFANGIFNPV